MEAGDVFVWRKFPNPKHGEVKDRWFICLWRTDLVSDPIFLHLCTTSASLSELDFKDGGRRAGHHNIYYKEGSAPFPFECFLDLNEKPYGESKEIIESCQNIEIKGKLTEEQIRQIYNKVDNSPAYSYKIKIDIYDSFTRIGIRGLKRPKKRN